PGGAKAEPAAEPAAAHAGSGGNGNSNGHRPLQRLQKSHELHEVKDLEKLFSQLEGYDLSIDDYFLTQEESVSGEKLMTKYALVSEEKTIPVAGVAQIIRTIHEEARKHIEVTRFKGLGEMNAEQLWDTTIDPSRRTLLRVTL